MDLLRVGCCPNCRTINHRPECACGFVSVPELITLEQYFGGPPPSPELQASAKDLLLKTNSLLAELGIKNVTLTSGYRSPEHNKAIGGATNSNHCKARAVDVADPDHRIGRLIEANLGVLTRRGMAMENLSYCERLNGNKWCHLQSVLPASGKPVFVPYPGPIKRI